MKKVLAVIEFFVHPLPMTYPSNPAEYEEYCRVMNELSDTAFASAPDPQPEHFESPDDSHLDGDWFAYDEPEDRYLDSMYEDQHDVSEYGMEGCCGDF